MNEHWREFGENGFSMRILNESLTLVVVAITNSLSVLFLSVCSCVFSGLFDRKKNKFKYFYLNFRNSKAIKKPLNQLKTSDDLFSSVAYLHCIAFPFVPISSNSVRVASKYMQQQWKTADTSIRPMPVIAIASPTSTWLWLLFQWHPSAHDFRSE